MNNDSHHEDLAPTQASDSLCSSKVRPDLLVPQALSVTIVVLVTMAAFELLKQWLFSPITIWRSHIITICFTSSLAFFLSRVIIGKFRSDLLREGATRDVADRAQTALMGAEQRYRNIFDEAIIGIFQSAPNGRYLSVNPALARMCGYNSPRELVESVTDISQQVYVDPKRREEFRLLMEHDGLVRNFECQLYRKDRSKMWMSVNARAIRKDGVVVRYEGMNEDITERRFLQEQLFLSQKLDAIGRLAGGVAHDFNNAIGVIVGYSALLKDRLVSDDKSFQYAEEIGKAGHRAASLTHQLLAFSRKQVLQPVVLDLNSAVTEMDIMLRRLIGDDIEMTIAKEPKLGRVKADLGQIEQIIMNLVVNARDAMPQGGRLAIETANAALDETAVTQYAYVKPGDYVMLSVSDTGCGMDKETQAHIFEPFYTTKEPGKGTGLGLSTVYGIVKQSGGYIWVYSEPDKGARLTIYLPRVEAPVQPIYRTQDKSTVPEGSETILLVEDDESMRTLTRSCLQAAGYKVLDMTNGETAIRFINNHPETIHLLLTDVVMPGISGRELAQSLAVSRPEVKLLYMSGYTADLITQHGVLEPGLTLLEKPFTKEILLRKVRTALDSGNWVKCGCGLSATPAFPLS